MNFDDELAKFQAELEAVERPSVTLGSYNQNYAQPKSSHYNSGLQPLAAAPHALPPPVNVTPPTQPAMVYQPQPSVQYLDPYSYTDSYNAGYTGGNQYAPQQQTVPVGGHARSSSIPASMPAASVSTNIVPGKGKAPQGAAKGKGSKGVFRTAGGEKWFDPTLEGWPENDFRVFVGDIGNEVNDEVLSRAFSKYSSFAKAKVVRDSRTKKSKGYGFVSFLDGNDFALALREMNGKYIGNRPCKLTKSAWADRCSEKRKQEAVAHVPTSNVLKKPKSVLHK